MPYEEIAEPWFTLPMRATHKKYVTPKIYALPESLSVAMYAKVLCL